MLQVARLAPKLLGEEASDLVVAFLRSQLNDDGGFKDRAGNSDLYYSVFGLEGLLALRVDLFSPGAPALTPSPGTPGEGWGEGSSGEPATPRVAQYLRAFGAGE